MDANIINKQLDVGLINSDILLSEAKFMDDSSRNAGDYNDNRYLPFYYHLGKQLKPKSVCQIGAKLGLVGACFLRSCKTVENWLVMDYNRDHTIKIITSNLKIYSGNSEINYFALKNEEKFKSIFDNFDLCFLTENFDKDCYWKHLEFLWEFLSPEGLLVADYITAHDVFHEFCRVKNREPTIFNTRYGIGIVQR